MDRRSHIMLWDGILDGNLLSTIHLMTADGKYLKQLSDVHDARDYQPDFSPVGLAVSPSSNKIRNLGWAEETRAQPPIIYAHFIERRLAMDKCTKL